MTFNKNDEMRIKFVKKEIEKTLSTRLLDLPSALFTFLSDSSILSGGAIASLMHDEAPNDYDLYLKDNNLITFFNQYVSNMADTAHKDLIKDANEKYYDSVKIPGKMVTANATTFKNGIQVITLHASNARNTFDFVHCMPWYDIGLNKLHISYKQYDAIIHKRLIKNDHGYASPLSQKRIEKYTDRGWRFK
jgi:hypothetical protein